MKLQGIHKLKVQRHYVCEALNSPEVLHGCIPECERVEVGNTPTGGGIITVVVTGKSFQGTVRVEDVYRRELYRIAIAGQIPAGSMTGSGELKLRRKRKTTLVEYLGQMELGSTIGSEDQRMIHSTSKMTACLFFTSLEAAARKISQSSRIESPLRRYLKRLLGRPTT